MNKPIIDPSTLSEEQRKTIESLCMEMRKTWKTETVIATRAYGALCQLALMEDLFGSEFLANLKRE